MSVKLHTLPNGFRIVTESMPYLKSAAVGVWVSTGARNERPEQNGIAHFLEHMAFKGTKRRSALKIAETIEDVGGYINAYTSREVTAYYARVLENDVPLALDIIGDILLNSVFDPKDIEVERGVILQEIGQALDTPDDVIFDWLQESAYRDQPMGRAILGTTERVGSFSREDLFEFVRTQYGAGEMILSAAGAVDHDQIVALATEIFGHLPASTANKFDAAVFTSGEYRKVKKLEQAHVAMAFASPAQTDQEIYTAQVYSVALGGGMSSRLFQEVREERGLCYSIFAQTGAYSDTGMMTVYAGTGADKVNELMHITVDEMRRAAEDMSDAEVERARAQMKAGLLMGLESPSSRAERLARVMQIWGHVPDIDEAIKLIDAVTTDHVRAFAKKTVSQEPVAMALYGPVKTAPTLAQLGLNRVA